ncbi:MAG: hypothetical protein BWK80_60890 [Desulfobacteraceae bacterium IS3]|nr:MAG: hypothetical protein BWK80_60890 [Desulfobacteraceae bacterium IS3]
MLKTRLNISLDQELADFIKAYAYENRTTASDLITQFILALKGQMQTDMNLILSDPQFSQALKDVQTRLREGAAEWHTFDEVFGE